MDGPEAEEGTSKIRGNIEIAYKTWGREDGEPWVLIHGWLDNAASFDLLAPELLKLSKVPLRLVCVDLAGHGRSGCRHNSVYHLIDYAADIAFLLDQLGIKEFSIIGHSLGTGISMILGGALTNRVKRVVLMEGMGSSETPGNGPKAFLDSLKEPPITRGEYNTIEDAAQKRSQYNVIGTLDIEAARILASRGVERTESGKVSWSYDLGVKLQSRSRLHSDTCDDFAKSLICPVLLVATGDGIFEKATILRQKFFQFSGYFLMFFIYCLAKVLSYVPFIGPKLTIVKQLPLVWLGMSIARRVRFFQNLQVFYLDKGGHHPHLLPTYVTPIAQKIIAFASKNQK